MKRWPTKPLRELITIEKGKKAPAVFPAPTKTSPRYLQIEDLRPDAGLKYCEPFKCPRATKSDVILAWDGANAGTVSCNLEGHIGSTLAILRPVGTDTLSAVFLSRFLQGNFEYLQTTATGATIPHVSKDALNSLQIPVPPLAEQERIVKLLDEADELRKLRVQSDRRAAARIPALFHEMFGGSNFKSVRVGDLTSLVTSGSTPRGGEEVYVRDGPYFIRSQNVQMNWLDLSDAACLPPEVHEQMARTKVEEGDVLLNITGASIGRVAWVDKLGREANVSQHVCLIRSKPDLLSPAYLSVFMSLPSTQFFILQIQAGASRQALNHQQVRALEIPLPPLALQKEFASRVTEIREMESAQSASRKRLDDLFQSMLHRAFEGEL